MSILNILQGRRGQDRRRAAARRHLGIESLEARQVLSTFTVTNLGDAGAGSLRQALISADAAGDAAIINLGNAPQGTISLQSALPDLSNTHGLTINGKTSIHVDLTRAGKSDGIAVEVDAGAVATINNLEFDNAPGRALGNHGTLSLVGGVVTGSHNGAVINYGVMGIANSTLKNNAAVHYGGGVDNTGGYLYLGSSTISGNSAGLLGGGVENYNGTLKVVGDTFTGNSAADGGAIHDAPKVQTTIDSSTFTGNSAPFGGALFLDGLAAKLTNNNIYDDSATYGGADVEGAVDPKSSNNLIGTSNGMSGISDNNPNARPYVAGALSNPQYPFDSTRPANFVGSDSARIRPVMEQKGDFVNGDPASGSFTYDYTVRTNAATLKITSGYLTLNLNSVVSNDNLHDNNPHYYPDGFVTGLEFADTGNLTYGGIDLWQGYDSTSSKEVTLAVTEVGAKITDDITGLPHTFNGAKKS